MKEDKQNIVKLELTDNDLEALDESMMRDVSGGKSNELQTRPIVRYGINPITPLLFTQEELA